MPATEVMAGTSGKKSDDLHQLASAFLKECPSLQDAVEEMASLASGDPDVLRALVREFFVAVVSAGGEPPIRREPQTARASRAAPLSGPTTLQLRAARVAQQRIAETLMDLLLIDRKPIGDWTIGECRAASVAKFREAQILKKIGNRFANIDPRVRVRDAIKVEDLQEIVKDAGSAASEAFRS